MANDKKKVNPNDDHNLNIKGLGFVSWAIILTIGTILFFISSYAMMILIIGMAPTIVATVTDKRYGSCASRTIGAMNFMGILPFLFDMIEASDPAALAKEISSTPSTWLFIFGSAFIGWVIIWVIPQITAAIFSIRADNRVAQIAKLQNILVDEWGPEIKEGINEDDYTIKNK